MTDISAHNIAHLVRQSRPLVAGDTVARAATVLRAVGSDSIPVVSGMQVIGMVHESDLLESLASPSTNGGSGSLPVPPDLVRPVDALLYPDLTVGDAAAAFTRSGDNTLPVVSRHGGYVGYLLRSDITAALSNSIRPATVGGLATPLGVHLTCGSQRGGVTDAALVLLGVLFGVLNILGFAIAALLYWGIERVFGQPLFAALMSEPAGVPNVYDFLSYVPIVAPIFTLLAGIRFLPVAGFHAAEHQTVHAIEQGEPLEYEVVRQMPRVHPRCGTNLAAAASIFIVMITAYPSPLVVFAAIMVVLLAWRSIGSWLQYHVTTKTASRSQIENGISAGTQLVSNYRDEVLGLRAPGSRLWNLGFPQIGIGLMLTVLLAEAVRRLFGLTIPFM